MILRIYDGRQFAKGLAPLAKVVPTEKIYHLPAVTQYAMLEIIEVNKSPRLQVTGSDLYRTVQNILPGCRTNGRVGQKCLIPFHNLLKVMKGYSTTVHRNDSSRIPPSYDAAATVEWGTDERGEPKPLATKIEYVSVAGNLVAKPYSHCNKWTGHNRMKAAGLQDEKQEIVLLCNSENLELSVGEFYAVLPTQKWDDYPAMPAFDPEREKRYNLTETTAAVHHLQFADKVFGRKGQRWINESGRWTQLRVNGLKVLFSE